MVERKENTQREKEGMLLTTAWAEFLQQFSSPFMDTLVYLITNVGSELFYTLALPVLYWVWNKEKAYRVGVVFLSSEFLNRYLKVLFKVPRPSATDSVRVIHPETGGGYAFPSSHAQGTTTFWGWLCMEVREKWLYVVSAVMIILVSLSRVYLNVHWPRDVIGGILIGILILIVWTLIFKYYKKDTLPVGLRISGAILIPLIAYLLSPHETEMLAGLLIGVSLGHILDEIYLDWSTKATFTKNVFKVVTGVAGFFIFRYGLKAIFPDIGLFHVLRYAIVGLWVTYLGPWFFTKMGWQD